jgi:hypothetical protein
MMMMTMMMMIMMFENLVIRININCILEVLFITLGIGLYTRSNTSGIINQYFRYP